MSAVEIESLRRSILRSLGYASLGIALIATPASRVAAHERMAAPWQAQAPDQEQADEDRDRERNDHRRKRGRVDLQAFNGAEHRDSRRDHAIAIEQGGADQADDEQGCARAAAGRVPGVKKRK